MDRYTQLLQQRFLLKVEIPEDQTQCWRWLGSKRKNGHGMIRVHGRLEGAHRVAWILRFGPIPAWAKVLHRCDNGWCVNAHHLFLGTMSDNTQDMLTKKRGGVQKLSLDQVREARELRADGIKLRIIGEKFGVSASQMSRVCNGDSWGWIGTP
jgi:hypothetical protein